MEQGLLLQLGDPEIVILLELRTKEIALLLQPRDPEFALDDSLLLQPAGSEFALEGSLLLQRGKRVLVLQFFVLKEPVSFHLHLACSFAHGVVEVELVPDLLSVAECMEGCKAVFLWKRLSMLSSEWSNETKKRYLESQREIFGLMGNLESLR